MKIKLNLHRPPTPAEAYPLIAHDLVPWTTNEEGFAGALLDEDPWRGRRGWERVEKGGDELRTTTGINRATFLLRGDVEGIYGTFFFTLIL
jgi:hypothetical protein